LNYKDDKYSRMCIIVEPCHHVSAVLTLTGPSYTPGSIDNSLVKPTVW